MADEPFVNQFAITGGGGGMQMQMPADPGLGEMLLGGLLGANPYMASNARGSRMLTAAQMEQIGAQVSQSRAFTEQIMQMTEQRKLMLEELLKQMDVSTQTQQTELEAAQTKLGMAKLAAGAAPDVLAYEAEMRKLGLGEALRADAAGVRASERDVLSHGAFIEDFPANRKLSATTINSKIRELEDFTKLSDTVMGLLDELRAETGKIANSREANELQLNKSFEQYMENMGSMMGIDFSGSSLKKARSSIPTMLQMGMPLPQAFDQAGQMAVQETLQRNSGDVNALIGIGAGLFGAAKSFVGGKLDLDFLHGPPQEAAQSTQGKGFSARQREPAESRYPTPAKYK